MPRRRWPRSSSAARTWKPRGRRSSRCGCTTRRSRSSTPAPPASPGEHGFLDEAAGSPPTTHTGEWASRRPRESAAGGGLQQRLPRRQRHTGVSRSGGAAGLYGSAGDGPCDVAVPWRLRARVPGSLHERLQPRGAGRGGEHPRRRAGRGGAWRPARARSPLATRAGRRRRFGPGGPERGLPPRPRGLPGDRVRGSFRDRRRPAHRHPGVPPATRGARPGDRLHRGPRRRDQDRIIPSDREELERSAATSRRSSSPRASASRAAWTSGARQRHRGPGLEFLDQARHGGSRACPAEDVVVIGGGNTAMDAARSAVRLGAKDVRVVYRRTARRCRRSPKRSTRRSKRASRIDELRRSGALWSTRNARTVLVCRRMTPRRTRRVRATAADASSTEPTLAALRCDQLLLALGQSPDLSILPEGSDDGRLPSVTGGLWSRRSSSPAATSPPGRGPSPRPSAAAGGRRGAYRGGARPGGGRSPVRPIGSSPAPMCVTLRQFRQ